jgi:hypothetical protein
MSECAIVKENQFTLFPYLQRRTTPKDCSKFLILNYFNPEERIRRDVCNTCRVFCADAAGGTPLSVVLGHYGYRVEATVGFCGRAG